MTKKNGVLYDVNERDLELLRENPEAFWDGVTAIGRRAFERVRDELTSLTISDNVEELKNNAFWGMRDLMYVTLPKNLVKIGEGAFAYTGIEKIEIPESVEYIGDGAFYYAENLKKVNMPKGLKFLGKNAFSNTRINEGDYSDVKDETPVKATDLIRHLVEERVKDKERGE